MPPVPTFLPPLLPADAETVEFAFTSTTLDRKVSFDYAAGSSAANKSSIVFVYWVVFSGRLTNSMCVSISPWLSFFLCNGAFVN